MYSIVSCLYVSCSGSITSVGEERAYVSAVSFTCYYVVSVSRGFPLDAGDRLRYFIVVLPVTSI